MRRRIAPLILVLAALALPAAAGVGVWTPLGPDGGTVHALLVDPADSRIVYAGTKVSGVFRSVDGGETWSPSSAGIGAGGRGVWIASLAADPRHHGTLYAGTLNGLGVFKSVDGGRLWSAASAGLPRDGSRYRPVTGLVVDPNRSRWIYAATHGGLFASADGGATWQPRGRRLPAQAVTALAAEPRGGRLWAAVANGQIFSSTDRGASWTASVRLPPLVLALAADPDHPGVVVAGTETGLYRTGNGGRRWARAGAGTISGRVEALAFHASEDRLYAAAQGVFVSRDGGLSWQRAESSPANPIVLALATAPGNVVYAGTTGDLHPGGVFRSQDGGRRWSFRSRGLSALRVADVAVDPADPERLYASVPRLGIFRSTDRGASWTRLAVPGIAAELVSEILLDPARPATILVNLGCSILRSDDGGDTWRLVVPEPVRCFDTLALDPRAPDALWGGNANTLNFEQGGIFHSADGGATWTHPPSFPEFFGARDVAVHPSDPEIVLAAGTTIAHIRPTVELAPQIFRTADGGETWRDQWRDLTDAAAIQVEIDPGESGAVYAVIVPGGLYRTTNGTSWDLVLAKEARFAAVTPAAVYAATALGDVLRSEDGGKTWTSIRRGLGWRVVTRLTVDPHDPRRLYAATETGGVYTYTEPE